MYHWRQCHAEAHSADPTLTKSPHRRINLIALTEKTLRSLDERATWNRGMRLLAQPLDELQAESPLKLSNLRANCRLRQV